MQDIELKEHLKLLNRKWMDAYIQHNSEFLKIHMSDSYIGTFPDGSVHNKQSEMEAVKSGTVAITEMYPVEMDIQLHNGNSAILTGKSKITANINGQNFSNYFRFTDVWVKIGKIWQAVASHVTQIAVQ